ncbi:outer membrane receptor protein involved in Fe transport [Sphingomonas insulae]|uniref:TonB-dependent receptor n=1 Tax=Sphingomonas insulae TaxID=424800 RepID=A0ABP3SVM4_9SPHN|nr:TonB-dependent receptor [Sphingomonas insulae]NIJ29422.1 outer membrane receptor protein involved in Fe transport [Sphingomonas insulae]
MTIVLAASALGVPVAAAPRGAGRYPVNVPAGPLDRALSMLAGQTASDIGSAEPDLGRTVVIGVRGRLTGVAALGRLLRDTPFAAQDLGGGVYRVIRRPRSRANPARVEPRPASPPAPIEPPASPPPEIVVTASKRTVSLLRFPGAITVLRSGSGLRLGDTAGDTMERALAATPILQGTALGAGRNKLFIRGVADSSFTGPTQATTNVYFGEVPVAYNGPDPGLSLYDMDRIEVLEGPQGALYGAGAIGGIIRLVPHPVDLDTVAADVSGGVSATRGGAAGGDIAAMVNLPLSGGAAGLRAVAYRSREGGYIADVRRALRNVNTTITSGGRADLRVRPASGWTMDAGVVLQSVASADLQYAERGAPPLSRASLLAQPFDQRYALGRLIVAKAWDDGLRLVSATGVVHRDASGRFDATRRARPTQPIAYDTTERSRLLSHETRLSRTRGDGVGWMVGVSLIQARDVYGRMYGPPDRLREIVGVSNRTIDAAVFGEAGMAPLPQLTVTLGGRLTHQRSDGEPTAGSRANAFIRGRSVTRIDPTIAASWALQPDLAAYARFHSGFRTGGITVAPGVGRVADLRPDTIRVVEVGIRKERRGSTGVAGSAGVSIADWRHVQADLVDRSGFPFTTNLGNARIHGLEAEVNWVPVRSLRGDLSLFLNDARALEPDAAVSRNSRVRLPNTPPFAMAASVAYTLPIAGNREIGVRAGWRYVGQSTIGTRAPFDVAQGGYGVSQLGGEWREGRVRLTATIDNVFDVTGDRFAGGNPFAQAMRDEYTPLQPRTVRIGGAVRW